MPKLDSSCGNHFPIYCDLTSRDLRTYSYTVLLHRPHCHLMPSKLGHVVQRIQPDALRLTFCVT
jgi:hypothetical protein